MATNTTKSRKVYYIRLDALIVFSTDDADVALDTYADLRRDFAGRSVTLESEPAAYVPKIARKVWSHRAI